MTIENFKLYSGVHCETTAIGGLLGQIDVELSEPLMFGLGEGLGFIFWKMKGMEFPFIGGRVKPDLIMENLCKNLGLNLEIKETSSTKKAWQNVTSKLQAGKAVGLKLDCFYLDYFTNKIHFAGHYATIYGYDSERAFLNDTSQQGKACITSLKNLELARNAKGPMSSKNKSFTISRQDEMTPLDQAIRKAMHLNATDFLNPPITNFGYKGILKTSAQIRTWFETSNNRAEEFGTCAMLMERAGTGGALFRNLFRDYLLEGGEILKSKEIVALGHEYAKIATKWTQVSELLEKAGNTENKQHIDRASEILIEISEQEKQAMEKLYSATL